MHQSAILPTSNQYASTLDDLGRCLVAQAQAQGFTDHLTPSTDVADAAMRWAMDAAEALDVDRDSPAVAEAIERLTALGEDHVIDMPSAAVVDEYEDRHAARNDYNRSVRD